MASSTGAPPSLVHRGVTSIRAGGVGPTLSGPPSPHTPLRTIHSSFGSPSSLRAEEEIILIEFGTRKLRVGFAGDPAPRGCIWFGPEQQRRVGDFRAWQADYEDDWRKRSTGSQWGRDYEVWKFDVRELDLGLVGDKIERALREVFTKYLLIDSKPRKMVAVLPSLMPTPLLSTVLDTLFNRFQPPTISLLSPAITTTVAAGVRSALVVDLGWSETVVTSVYEYREVQCDRSVRGGRMLVKQMHKLLRQSLAAAQGRVSDDELDKMPEDVISFEECEDITSRLAWCKSVGRPGTAQAQAEGLPTVREQDESELQVGAPDGSAKVRFRLKSAHPPTMLELSHDQIAEPCENTFFESQYSRASFDDEEVPLHLLVYRSLLQLPTDIRAVCMSRMIFTGGCSQVLGLRGRLFDEVSRIVRERGWDPVFGKGAEKMKLNPKINGAKRRTEDRDTGDTATGGGVERDGVWHDVANEAPEVDPVEAQLRRAAGPVQPQVQGTMRAIDSLGPWGGASLIAQLKILAVATVDRELWQQQGVAGAGRAGDVDVKAQQRQSMGPGGLMRSAAAGSNWTLGVWGSNV